VEIIGKTYTAARVIQNDQAIEIRSQSLSGGNYVDVFTGIQRIVNSNFRMELSIGFPAINRSYQHFYPLFSIGFQKYLFRKSKANEILKPLKNQP
jgi:hypothetical protein